MRPTTIVEEGPVREMRPTTKVGEGPTFYLQLPIWLNCPLGTFTVRDTLPTGILMAL